MEKIYAVIKNSVVENTVIADEAKIVELFHPKADAVIEVTEATSPASIGFSYKNGKFIPPSPFKSWTLNENTGLWDAPTPRPKLEPGQYCDWDEEALSWTVADIPIMEDSTDK